MAPFPGVRSAWPGRRVVLASRRDGWLYERYGRGLWATHDRGGHWRKLSLGGDIEQMAAAVAEREQVTVLHYDSDYDLIAQVTGQPAQWSCPAALSRNHHDPHPHGALATLGR